MSPLVDTGLCQGTRSRAISTLFFEVKRRAGRCVRVRVIDHVFTFPPGGSATQRPAVRSSAPKRVLVTGAAGFVGFHLSRVLRAQNPRHLVVGLDNYNDYYDVKLKIVSLPEQIKFPGRKGGRCWVPDSLRDSPGEAGSLVPDPPREGDSGLLAAPVTR